MTPEEAAKALGIDSQSMSVSDAANLLGLGDAPKPLSRMQKYGQGLRDPIDAGAQLLTKTMEGMGFGGVVNAGNKVNNWLADKTGLVGRLPEGGVDQQVRENNAVYEDQRKAAGETGIDGYRMLGNILNPANIALASKIPKAASLAGRIGVGAASSGAMGALTPVVNGDFLGGKLDQIELATSLGGAFPVAGAGMRYVADGVRNARKSTAEWLMQSALKPVREDLKSGDAKIAVRALLENKLNASSGGVDSIRGLLDDLNSQISGKISNSNAVISRNDVLGAVNDTRNKFTRQVDPEADLAAINGVAERFGQHPFFKKTEEEGRKLLDAVNKAESEKITALQAAGKLKTFAEQQRNLAGGKPIASSLNQPEGQLYFNVGNNGKDILSPSAYPVAGMPRFPARYTHNMDRVPEGLSGYDDAMAAFVKSRNDQNVAEDALKLWEKSKGTMPVQQAQDMKQGTYKILAKKYGQIGTADTEAQKSLARGLKDEIAKAVPGVGDLNRRESDLIKALDVTERRVLQQSNNNPIGFAMLSQTPLGFMAMMADKSALAKSLGARAINPSQATQGGLLNGVLDSQITPYLIRSGLLSSYNADY